MGRLDPWHKRLKRVPLTWVALGILGVTVLFRGYYYSTHINFAQDQARDLMIVAELAETGKWIVTYGSKASVADFHWPSLHYQLLMVIGRVTNFDPLAPNWLIVGLESLTPVFLFLLLKFFVRVRYAVITALLYAVSPAPTIYGTFSWNPNLIPLLTASSVYAWFAYYFEKKSWWLVLGTFLPLLAFQLHFQAGLVLLFYLPYLGWCIYTDRRTIQYILIGLGLALLSYSPYILAEISNQGENTLKIWNFFTGEHTRIYDRVSKPDFILNYIPGFFERVLFNRTIENYWLGRGLLVMGIGVIGWLSYKKPKTYLPLFSLIIAMLIMVRLYKGDKLDYYLSALFIMPYIFIGLLLQLCRSLGVLIGSVLIAVSLQQTTAIAQSNAYADMEAVVELIERNLGTKVVVEFREPDYRYPIVYGLERRGINWSEGDTPDALICRPDQECEGAGVYTLIGNYAVAISQ